MKQFDFINIKMNKYYLLIIAFNLSLDSYAQVEFNSKYDSEINSLKGVIQSNKDYITILQKKNDSLSVLLQNKELLKKQELINQIPGKTLYCIDKTLLYKEENSYDFINPIEFGDSIKVIESSIEFSKVYHNSKIGFVRNARFADISVYSKMMQQKSEQEKAIKEQEQAIKLANNKMLQDKIELQNKMDSIEVENEVVRIKKLYDKYGKVSADKILEKKIWIGMSDEMARQSWGLPTDINRTVTKYGTSEQWVYPGNNYLYFENGKLVSWQD